METEVKKKFNKRAFTAVVIFVAGLILPISGIMNHKLQFDSLTTQRHFWMSVHNFAAILFVLFVVIHVSYNWRSLIHYIRNLKNHIISKEAIFAILFVIIIVGLFSTHVFHT
jgi:uncharacterized membrane protein HdeD (DUF308 family)